MSPEQKRIRDLEYWVREAAFLCSFYSGVMREKHGESDAYTKELNDMADALLKVLADGINLK